MRDAKLSCRSDDGGVVMIEQCGGDMAAAATHCHYTFTAGLLIY